MVEKKDCFGLSCCESVSPFGAWWVVMAILTSEFFGQHTIPRQLESVVGLTVAAGGNTGLVIFSSLCLAFLPAERWMIVKILFVSNE